MSDMDMSEASEIFETVLKGLIAAGMDDEESMAQLASNLLRQHNPEVLEAFGRHAIEAEIRSVASEMGVSLD